MEKKLSKKDIVKMLLNKSVEEENEQELMELLFDEPIAVDVDKEINNSEKFGDRVADKITAVAGSWTFIILFITFLLGWIILNLSKITHLDPYPFILLNLVLSCVAALQAPVIMMSQNRSAKKDTLRGKNDYKTDLKSELILEQLHEDMHKILVNQNKILKEISKDENNIENK